MLQLSFIILFTGDSESCIRINFRNLLKSLSCFKMKEALCKHLYEKGLVAQIPTYDKECHLIKAGMKLKKPGCDCFLEFIRWDNLAFLEKLILRFEERRKNGNNFISSDKCSCISGMGDRRATETVLILILPLFLQWSKKWRNHYSMIYHSTTMDYKNWNMYLLLAQHEEIHEFEIQNHGSYM